MRDSEALTLFLSTLLWGTYSYFALGRDYFCALSGFLVYSASPTAVHYRGFSVYSARASPHFAFRVAPAMHVYVYFFIYLWHGF